MACVKKIFEDNQNPIIFEVTIIIALFLELTNKISLRRLIELWQLLINICDFDIAFVFMYDVLNVSGTLLTGRIECRPRSKVGFFAVTGGSRNNKKVSREIAWWWRHRLHLQQRLTRPLLRRIISFRLFFVHDPIFQWTDKTVVKNVPYFEIRSSEYIWIRCLNLNSYSNVCACFSIHVNPNESRIAYVLVCSTRGSKYD